MGKPFDIDAQERRIKKLWKICIFSSVGIFSVSSVVMAAFLLAGHDPKAILTVFTLVFQVLVMTYALSFFIPLMLGSYLKMGIGIEMSKEGLEIGEKTSSTLNSVQKEVMPLISDSKDLAKKVHTVSDEITKIISQIQDGDKSLANTVKNAVAEARKAMKEGESQIEKWIWDRVDLFLEGVFGSSEEERDDNGSEEAEESSGSVEKEVEEKLHRGRTGK